MREFCHLRRVWVADRQPSGFRPERRRGRLGNVKTSIDPPAPGAGWTTEVMATPGAPVGAVDSRESSVLDLIFVALTLVCGALLAALVRGLEKL